MYAVFINGGKQYKVYKGDLIQLEKLDVSIGEIITFKHILMISESKNITFGNPFIKNKIIEAKIINHGRLKKVKILKFNRRKHYKRQQGHRQSFTNVSILNIKNINRNKIYGT